jgi:hypothetical protein
VAAKEGLGFDHTVQRLRADRGEPGAKQPIIDELVAAVVTLINRPRWRDLVKPLKLLGTSDEPLTPEAHATCPGHVAWIDEAWIQSDRLRRHHARLSPTDEFCQLSWSAHADLVGERGGRNVAGESKRNGLRSRRSAG